MLRGKHTLMREGARGRATVLREQRRGPGTRDWRQYVDARFQTPDGAIVEFTDHILHADVEGDFVSVGDAVPVRYDPRDTKRIVLDIPALTAEITARNAGRTMPEPEPEPAATVPAGNDAQPGTGPSGMAADEVMVAVEQMAQLGELHHRGTLTDDQYQAEKVALQATLRKRLGLS